MDELLTSLDTDSLGGGGGGGGSSELHLGDAQHFKLLARLEESAIGSSALAYLLNDSDRATRVAACYAQVSRFPAFFDALLQQLHGAESKRTFRTAFESRAAECVAQSYATSAGAGTDVSIGAGASVITSASDTVVDEVEVQQETTLRRAAVRVMCDPGVLRFAQVAGLESLKMDLFEAFIFPRLRPELYADVNRPRSALLHGVPGTGKTHILRALAGELQRLVRPASDWHFLPLSPATLLSKWTGESEKAMRSAFRVAHALAPCVLFVDEIDALGAARETTDASDLTSRRVVTEFLMASESLSASDDVILVAATNCVTSIDAALLRRFDKIWAVPLPCAASRCELVRHFLDGAAHTLSAEQIVRIAHEDLAGLTASDIRLVCADACGKPMRALAELAFRQTAASGTSSSCSPLMGGSAPSTPMSTGIEEFTTAIAAMHVRREQLSACISLLASASLGDSNSMNND